MKKLRYFIEYILLLPILTLIDLLSVKGAMRLAAFVADMLYYVGIRRRLISKDNIIKCGITTERKEVAHIARESYRSFAYMAVESMKSQDIFGDSPLEECVKMEMTPEVREVITRPGQGVILATGHIGSWELAAHSLSEIKPVAGVARTMSNPHVEKIVQKRMPRSQFHLMPKYDPTKPNRFLQTVKEGHILALMIDQHARARGIELEFFGRTASSYPQIAMLHLVTGTPLVFGYCIRKDGGYVIRVTGPFVHKPTGDKQADILAVLNNLNAELEKAVRETPTQYMWGHRRWRKMGEK